MRKVKSQPVRMLREPWKCKPLFMRHTSVRAIEPEENRSILKLSRAAASLGADSSSDARNAYKHLQACQDEMAVLSGDVRSVLFEEGNVPGSVLV